MTGDDDGNTMTEASDAEPRHTFTKDELESMLYLWDVEASKSVEEYLYMKKEWLEPHVSGGRPGSSTLDRDQGEEDLVYLDDLVTESAVHVILFYAPWCPHCVAFKGEFVEIAAEVSRRSVGVPVYFHAVSCDLFGMICRAYEASAYPVVMGFKLGANIREPGIELNPVGGSVISAATIAEDLDLSLAVEPRHRSEAFNSSSDRQVAETAQAKEIATKKSTWNSWQSSVDAHFHDAAASLIFLIRHSVFVNRDDHLDDVRALALKEFFELLDWTTPQAWNVRVGFVQDILINLPSIVSSSRQLTEIIDAHVSKPIFGAYWGGLKNGSEINDTAVPANKWTQGCNHQERSLGFTCGLWHLFHIITIGAAHHEHQLYGFLSGYLTSPADVADIIARFIEHFFGCEICRRNFLDYYDNCGALHCERLPITIPSFAGSNHMEDFELALWFHEVHNHVSLRIMNETAQRQLRSLSQEEKQAAIFPPDSLCTDCWQDRLKNDYRPDEMIRFLMISYWPMSLPKDSRARSLLVRRQRISDLDKFSEPTELSHWLYPICWTAFAVFAIYWFISKRRTRNTNVKTL